jgi:kynurenine formamidase
MKLISLSHTIDNEMAVHPYDAPTSLYQDKFLHSDTFNNYRLEMGMHTGTHIDTAMHLTDNKKFINEYDLHQFCGKTTVIDVRNECLIKYNSKFEVIQQNDIVLLFTGHEEKYGEKEYFTKHPIVDISVAEFLISKKIKMLGFDMPSPDKSPFNIHKKIFEAEILILENLRNLESLLDKEVNIYAFPLNIKADSSIVSVVAEINDSRF